MNAPISTATVTRNSTFGATSPTTVDALLATMYQSGTWPVNVHTSRSYTPNDGPVPGVALVGDYSNGSRVLAQHGKRHTATTPEEWASILHAAELAGARPFFGGATKDGGRVLACFDVGAPDAAIRSSLVIADSYTGDLKLSGGFCASRNRCANMIASMLRGGNLVGLRHTASLPEKIEQMKAAIRLALASGEKIAALYARAEVSFMTPALAREAFEALCPTPGPDASQRARTTAQSDRAEIIAAGRLDVNRVSDERGNVANFWNAMTYGIDRQLDGTHRRTKGGGSSLDSMIFGSRGARVAEVLETIEVIMADGRIEERTRSQAIALGVPAEQALGFNVMDLDVSPT